MIKLKFIWLFLAFFCLSAHASTPINICLTGKIELILPDYKTAFLNAVDLAISQHSIHKNVQMKSYFYDNKPLSALRIYDHMLHDDCAAIIGFEYLSDILLVIKQQPNDNVPIFTSYAGSSDTDKYPNNIFIFVPSYDYQAKKMITYLQKKYNKINNVLVITEVDRADLMKYKLAYKTQLIKKTIDYTEFNFISSDSQFNIKFKKFIRDKNYNFIFVFAGAVASTKILNCMNNHKIVFIGTENFGSSTNQSVFVRLKDKKIKAYIIRNIDFLKMTPLLKQFQNIYIKNFGVRPSPFSTY